jgi:8-oxo-dGTP diphosphatase
MAFDHREIVDYAVRRLRSKVGYSSLGFQLLPSEFTISELQHVYEAVLGLSINRGNFWRKVVDRGVIEPTGKERSVRGKRAYLFRFTQQAFGLREEPDGFIEA